MTLGIAMSYSAGACVHAFALFTYESLGCFAYYLSANQANIDATTTNGQAMTVRSGINGHQSIMGTSISTEFSRSLWLAV